MTIARLNTPASINLDLTANPAVLSLTPSAVEDRWCQPLIMFGDGTNNLDGSGGLFEITITIGGQIMQPSPQYYEFSAAIRAGLWINPFPVPANAAVTISIQSPNADSNVAVTAYLFADDLDTVYRAELFYYKDADDAADMYMVQWFKNGVPVVSGVTSQTIWVFDDSGADVVGTQVAPVALIEIGTSGTFLHAETVNRLTAGVGAMAHLSAVIDGSTRTDRITQIGRDAA